MITQTAIAARNRNEILRLEASAIKPIMGGPIKNPVKLIVETAAIAGPGCMVPDFPAAEYTMGTTDEIPEPINRKPIIAGINIGKITAIIHPKRLNKPLICSVLLSPNLCENQSATNRPEAIAHMPVV